MQYLKEDIRQRIITSAMAQFRENGFKNTSMRKIAAHAGIVSGNIYRYYKSKEDMFESIVHPVAVSLETIKNDMNATIPLICRKKGNESYINIVRRVSAYFFKLFDGKLYELLLIINSSDGTKYDNCKELIDDAFYLAITKIYAENCVNVTDDDAYVLKMISKAYASGLNLLLCDCYDNPETFKRRFEIFISILFKRITLEF